MNFVLLHLSQTTDQTSCVLGSGPYGSGPRTVLRLSRPEAHPRVTTSRAKTTAPTTRLAAPTRVGPVADAPTSVVAPSSAGTERTHPPVAARATPGVPPAPRATFASRKGAVADPLREADKDFSRHTNPQYGLRASRRSHQDYLVRKRTPSVFLR